MGHTQGESDSGPRNGLQATAQGGEARGSSLDSLSRGQGVEKSAETQVHGAECWKGGGCLERQVQRSAEGSL